MSKAVALTILQRLRRGFIRRSLWQDRRIKIFVNPCRNSSTRRDLTIWMTRTAGAGRLFPPGTALGEGPNLQYCRPESTRIFILIDGGGKGGRGRIFRAWNRIRGRAEFTVLPPGVNPNLYTYRWMRNGVPLTIGFNPENLVGSFTENNGSKLIIRGAKPSDNGRYWAEVTSLPAAGSCTVFSEAATLAVKVRPPALNTYYTTNLGSSGNLPGSRDTEAPNPGILRQIDMCVPRSKVVMGLSLANGEEQGLQFRWQESRPLNASAWSDYADITANPPYADFSTVTTSRLELNQADRNAVSGYRYRLKVTHGELGCIDYYPKRGEWYAGNGGGGGVSNRGDRQLY